MFPIAFHPGFKKDIKKLPHQVIDKLESSLDIIQINPFKFPKLKGDLSDVYKYELKVLGVSYRIAYTIDEDEIVILMFRKRENFYDYLRRRIE